MQTACEKHRNVRIFSCSTIWHWLTKGRPRSFPVLAVIRRMHRGSRFYDADHDPSKCLLNRLHVLQRQSMSSPAPHQAPPSSLVSTSPCHRMTVRLVNPIDRCTLAESPVLRLPPTTVSVIDHQCDGTETLVSCVDQGSVSTAECISVSQASFSGKQVLELWSIFFGSVDVSEAFGSCSGSGTPSPSTQASLDKRSSSCRNHSSEGATAVFSCMCPEPVFTSDPAEPATSDGLNETDGDPGRRGHWNYPRRSKRGAIRNSHRTRGQSSGRGTTWWHRVMSTASSALPVCSAFDELLVFRGYQKTLPAFSRSLPDSCC